MTVPVLPSRITAVMVLRRYALVTREAELVITDQVPDAVRLTGLPLALDDTSVQVRIKATGDGATPVASDVRVGLEVPEADQELAPPKDEELEQARRQVTRLEDQLEQTKESVARLHQLEAPVRPRGAWGEPPPPSPAEARLALLDLTQSELDRLLEERTSLKRQLQEAQEQLKQLEDRWQRATLARQARRHELRKSLVVQLRSDADQPAQSCRLVAEYLVPGACWAPSYVLRFAPDYSSAELAMRAMVCQASGEDWSMVDLTLSTADPVRWTELPELPELRIGRAQPAPPRTGWREPPQGAETLLADYDRAREQTKAAARESRQLRTSVSAGLAVDAEPIIAAPAALPAADVEIEEVLDEMINEEVCYAAEAETEELDLADLMTGGSPDDDLPMPMPPPAAAMALRSPPPKALMKKARARHGAKPPRPASAPAAAQLPEELVAPADLLSYGRLRMAGPDSDHRGGLQPVKTDQLYVELLAALRVEISFDVMAVVTEARSQSSAAASLSPPAGYSYPQRWQDFDHAYVAESPVTVQSDCSFHNLPLLQRSTKTELRYLVVPRETLDAFRFVSLSNPLQAPLPDGPADIYVGGDYLLTSKLHSVAPNGTTELGLGVEQGLKVARNTRFREKTSGLLSGTLSLEHEIEIEIANNLAQPARVEIRERLPITREGEDEVTVELTSVEPAWQQFKQERRPITGAYRWQISVNAGDQRKLLAQYVITLPAKYELTGGNRREA